MFSNLESKIENRFMYIERRLKKVETKQSQLKENLEVFTNNTSNQTEEEELKLMKNISLSYNQKRLSVSENYNQNQDVKSCEDE